MAADLQHGVCGRLSTRVPFFKIMLNSIWKRKHPERFEYGNMHGTQETIVAQIMLSRQRTAQIIRM